MQDQKLSLDERTTAEIRKRASKLADAAPPLSSAQIVALRAIFGRGACDRR